MANFVATLEAMGFEFRLCERAVHHFQQTKIQLNIDALVDHVLASSMIDEDEQVTGVICEDAAHAGGVVVIDDDDDPALTEVRLRVLGEESFDTANPAAMQRRLDAIRREIWIPAREDDTVRGCCICVLGFPEIDAGDMTVRKLRSMIEDALGVELDERLKKIVKAVCRGWTDEYAMRRGSNPKYPTFAAAAVDEEEAGPSVSVRSEDTEAAVVEETPTHEEETMCEEGEEELSVDHKVSAIIEVLHGMGMGLSVTREAVKASLILHQGEEFATMTAIANSSLDAPPSEESVPEKDQEEHQDADDGGWVMRPEPTSANLVDEVANEEIAEEESEECFSSKSIKELKAIIDAHGGSYQGVVEKAELVERAREARAKAPAPKPSGSSNGSGSRSVRDFFVRSSPTESRGPPSQDRNPCRYGMDCRSKEPKHFERFKHPPGLNTARRQGTALPSAADHVPWRQKGSQPPHASPAGAASGPTRLQGDSVLEALSRQDHAGRREVRAMRAPTAQAIFRQAQDRHGIGDLLNSSLDGDKEESPSSPQSRRTAEMKKRFKERLQDRFVGSKRQQKTPEVALLLPKCPESCPRIVILPFLTNHCVV